VIASVDWSTAVLTLASTMLGAVLALVGSIWVARRDVVRTRRIKLYEELLPRIEQYMSDGVGLLGGAAGGERDRLMTESLNELLRTARLAGKNEFKLANDLVSELAPGPPDWPPEPLDQNGPAYRTLRRFISYLKDKIR
jgi:hypothetical protein